MSSDDDQATWYRTSKVRNLRSMVLELYQFYHDDVVAKKGDDSMDLIMGRALDPDFQKLADKTALLCPPELFGKNIQSSITQLCSALKEFRKKLPAIEFLFGALLNTFEAWERQEETIMRNKYGSSPLMMNP
jgi:hypothetical protein